MEAPEEGGLPDGRILLAEDNPVNQELVKVPLTQGGYECVCVENGEEAVEALIDGDFDLVLMDCQMPGVDGFEATRRIRSMKDTVFAQIPIIALTASDLSGDKEHCLESGMNDFLTKPIDSHLLIQTIQKWLTRSEPTISSADETQLEQSVPDPVELAAENEELPFHGLRVLIAEDNKVNQEVAREMLLIYGCEVHIAENGKRVLEALSRQSFDLILMDCQMPEMDGYEATRKIRETEPSSDSRERTPIVALTAHAMKGDRERCLDAGMDDYLSKPLSQNDLERVLAEWVKAEVPQPPVARESKVTQDTNGPGIDPKALDQIRQLDQDGSAGILERVLQIYLDESSDLFSKIRDAINKNDAQGLRAAAHSLKSSSAQVGAMELSEFCKEMESIGRRESVSGAEEILTRTELKFEEARSALSRELERTRRQANG
jgi:CheY-like chemotaxis protein/HPt (histidine-containing phosphotransfer) domain-containing protein